MTEPTVKLRGEDRLERAEPGHLVDVRGRDRAGDELGDAEVGALQHEERAEGDQEAGNPGAHHEISVEEPDDQREDQRDDRADPEVQAELVAEHGVDEPCRGDDDTSGQVELATDHQHPDRDGDDADRGGLVEHREERGG